MEVVLFYALEVLHTKLLSYTISTSHTGCRPLPLLDTGTVSQSSPLSLLILFFDNPPAPARELDIVEKHHTIRVHGLKEKPGPGEENRLVCSDEHLFYFLRYISRFGLGAGTIQ